MRCRRRGGRQGVAHLSVSRLPQALLAQSLAVLLLSARLNIRQRGRTVADIKSPEDKIAAAILTLASALRDQNLVSDGSVENIFGFYRRYLEAVQTGRLPAK